MTEEFLRRFAVLPETVKAQARKAHRLWRQNPDHPSLKFKKVHSTDAIYSVRVSLDWRVLGLLDDDAMTWFWIGSHADYDRLLDQQ